MDIKVLFNGSSVKRDVSVGWGLSFLVGQSVLFDTGENGDILMKNVHTLEIDLSLVQDVIISHDHWDHIGGLWEVLKGNPAVNVHICPSFSGDTKNKLKGFNNTVLEHYDWVKISENVYSTGEIEGEYKGGIIAEQALVIDTKKGLTVITGCAHPGIVKILDVVKEYFPDKNIYTVIGGFHLSNKNPSNADNIVAAFRNMGIDNVGATHCSGEEAERLFKQEYGANFISTNIGDSISV